MPRNIIRYGLLLFAGFAAFFLLMYVLGLGDVLSLRFVNYIIHLVVLWFAIRDWSKSHPVSLREYPAGLGFGIAMSLFGTVLFSIFMSVILGMDPNLMASIQEKLPEGYQLSPVVLSAFIVMEHLAVSLIGSYIYIRILEREQMGTE